MQEVSQQGYCARSLRRDDARPPEVVNRLPCESKGLTVDPDRSPPQCKAVKYPSTNVFDVLLPPADRLLNARQQLFENCVALFGLAGSLQSISKPEGEYQPCARAVARRITKP